MAAGRAFASYDPNALTPSSDNLDYDSYLSRRSRYATFEAYYLNMAYSDLRNTLSQRIKIDSQLYRHIRSVRNPVKRLVDLYPALVYPGSLNLTDASKGAIPIDTDNAALRTAIVQGWKWSNWANEKSVYVRNGASLGDTWLTVVDDPYKRKVWMEVTDPNRIYDATFDAQGNVKAVVFQWESREEVDLSQVGIGYTGALPTQLTNKIHTDNLVINGDWYETYRDGDPYEFYTDADGNPIARWPNEYGFVPVVLASHKRLRNRYGAPPIQGVTGKIDELNDIVSHLHDQIRNAVDVIWYFAGVSMPSQLDATGSDVDRGGRKRDTLTAIYGPEGSEPHAMIADIDIGAALQAIQAQEAEVVADLPELALAQARDQLTGNVSGVTVQNLYRDATGLIEEAQGNYDSGLIRAQMMMVSIGGYRGYDGFEDFDLGSYDRGELMHTIKDRPIFNDDIGKQGRVTALLGTSNLSPEITGLLLEELDYDEKTVKRVIAAQTASEQSAAAAVRSNTPDGTANPDAQTGNAGTPPAPSASDGSALADIYDRVGLGTSTAAQP